MAFIFLDGGPYQFTFFTVFVGVYATLQCLRNRSGRPLAALALILFLGSGLAAIKLFPVWQTVSQFPRTVTESNFYGAPFSIKAPAFLYQAFLARSQEHSADLWMPYILNVGSYVGLLPMLFAIVGIIAFWRQRWVEIVTAVLFIWITLGSVMSWTPWDLLDKLPGLSMLRVPSRFNVFVLLLIALLAALGLQVLAQRWGNIDKSKLFCGIILMVVAADLLWVNGEVFKVAFSIPPVAVQRHDKFINYRISPFWPNYKGSILYKTFPNWPSALYPAVLENRGVIENYRTIPFPSHALAFGARGYRGEVRFLDGEGGLVDYMLTPNVIAARTTGRAGTLVFNCNYDGGWKCKGSAGAAVFDQNGLLAVRLSEGQKMVMLSYRPFSFVLGASVSFLFLAGFAAFPLFRKKVPIKFFR